MRSRLLVVAIVLAACNRSQSSPGGSGASADAAASVPTGSSSVPSTSSSADGASAFTAHPDPDPYRATLMHGPFASPDEACSVLASCAGEGACSVCKRHPKIGGALDNGFLEAAAMEMGQSGYPTSFLPALRTAAGWWVGETALAETTSGGMQALCTSTLHDWDASVAKLPSSVSEGVLFRVGKATTCTPKAPGPEHAPTHEVGELGPALWCAVGASGKPSCTAHGEYKTMVYP